jgi:SRSO17 transposase
VAGGRWRIEECFAAAKNEAGLASDQVRDYTAWYRHITLAMLAHAYLSATRASAEKGGLQPEPSSSSR